MFSVTLDYRGCGPTPGSAKSYLIHLVRQKEAILSKCAVSEAAKLILQEFVG
jgi:hypothetical protein